MNPARARLMKRLAGELDGITAFVPSGYEVTILLRNKTDAKAHIMIGQTDPRKVAEAVADLIDDPESRVGIANVNGPAIEI